MAASSAAGCQPVGVTMITRGSSPGTWTSLPRTWMRRFSGESICTQSCAAADRDRRVALLHRPVVGDVARRVRDAHDHVRRAAQRRHGEERRGRAFRAVTAGVVFGVAAGDVAAARLPRRDDDHRQDRDRGERDQHDVRLDPPVAPLRPGRRAARARLVLVLAADEPGVELVDVELAVEAEVLGVGAQESLDVGLGRQQLELLVLEGAQVLAADLRRELGLREVDARGASRASRRLLPISNTGPRRVARLGRDGYCAQRSAP